MIGTATGDVYSPATHTFNDVLVADLNVNDPVEPNIRSLHGLGLRNRARETIEQVTIKAVGLGESLFHQINDDVIAHKSARIHDLFSFNAQGCTGFHCRAKHVARRDLGDTKLVFNDVGLRSLARARGSQKNNFHNNLSPPEKLGGFKNLSFPAL